MSRHLDLRVLRKKEEKVIVISLKNELCEPSSHSV